MQIARFLALICVIPLLSTAQSDTDFKPDVIAITNPSWYRQAGKSGKNSVSTSNGDSVYIDFTRKYGKKEYPYALVKYKGDFKNGLFHGQGEIMIKDEGTYPYNSNTPAISIYRGSFENGVAHGYGVYTLVITYAGQPKEVPIFTGVFENGMPLRGFTRTETGPENNRHGVVYYSGDVIMKRWTIFWHGFGTLYMQRTATTTNREFDYEVVDGSFYAGQFFYNQAHGFAIANINYEPGDYTGNLQTLLTGAGEIFHSFNTLPVTITAGVPVQAASPVADSNKKFKTLFPDYAMAVTGTVAIDNNISYTGQLVNGLPYGFGYIAGKDGYRDYSFWKNGVKLSVEEILKYMLPDSSMTVPKQVNRTALNYVNEYNKKTKQTVYRVEKTKLEQLTYYGKLKRDNSPEGWGFLFSNERVPGFDNTFYYYALNSYLGEFNGTDMTAEKDISKTCAPNKFYYWGLKQWQNEKRGGYIYSYPISKGYADVNFYLTNKVAITARPGEIVRYYTRQGEKLDREKEVASRKKASIGTVYLAADLANSYVTDISGNRLNTIVIPKNTLKEGDYVFINDNFYPHNGIGILATPSENGGFISTGTLPEKVLVIRGYSIPMEFDYKPTTCNYCKDRPTTSTYTGTAYTGREETNVYRNNSGGVNIVTTPVIKTFIVTVNNASCKQCRNEWKYTKKPITIVRL